MSDILDIKLYESIKKILENVRQKAYAAANFAMVEAHWNMGKAIVPKCLSKSLVKVLI